MENKKRTSDKVLHEWFIDLNENPLRISRFDLVELSELYKYVNDIKMTLLIPVYDFLNINQDYPEEWARNNYSKYGCNLNRFEFLLNLIREQFDVLNKNDEQPHNISFRKCDIFKNDDDLNKKFFNYIIENTSHKINRRFLSDLYFNLNPKYINCKKYEFALYWNSLDFEFKIGIYKNNAVGLDNFDYEISKEFKQLETSFFRKQ